MGKFGSFLWGKITVLIHMMQMSRSRRSLRDPEHNSPEGTDEEDLRSPVSEHGDPVSPVVSRGRQGKSGVQKEDSDAMDVMH